MVAVRLLRTIGCIEEEYGRICFDGQRVCYVGLSSVFIKYLEQGINGTDCKCYQPDHGIRFLENLKNHFAEGPLKASDILYM
jgi:hypothetical protein